MSWLLNLRIPHLIFTAMISTCEPLSWVLTESSSVGCLLSIVLDLDISGYRMDLCALNLRSNMFRYWVFYLNYFYKMLIVFKYIYKILITLWQKNAKKSFKQKQNHFYFMIFRSFFSVISFFVENWGNFEAFHEKMKHIPLFFLPEQLTLCC